MEQPPRTLLEQIVRESHWTIDEHCQAFDKVSRQRGERATLSPRQFCRWMTGEVRKARAASRRVAEACWGYTFDELVRSPEPGRDNGARATDLISAGSTRVEFRELTSTSWDGVVVRWTQPNHLSDQTLFASGRPITPMDVEVVRATTEAFFHLDLRFGGGHAGAALAQCLQSEVLPRLALASPADRLGRSYLSAAGHMTFLAGWMAYDAGRHPQALQYMGRALDLAEAAEDLSLGGRVLSGMSHQANYLGHYGAAVHLARAAQARCASRSTATGWALYSAMEARALASRQDRPGCREALHRTEAAFVRRSVDDDPDWLRFFDEAELAAELAHCSLDLGDTRAAERHVHTSMAACEQLYIRSLTFVRTVLAASLVEQGQLDAGLGVAHEVLATATDLRSARTRTYVTSLVQRLDRWRDARPVRDFAEMAEAKLTAAATWSGLEGGPALP
jgi:hypothetical protein